MAHSIHPQSIWDAKQCVLQKEPKLFTLPSLNDWNKKNPKNKTDKDFYVLISARANIIFQKHLFYDCRRYNSAAYYTFLIYIVTIASKTNAFIILSKFQHFIQFSCRKIKQRTRKTYIFDKFRVKSDSVLSFAYVRLSSNLGSCNGCGIWRSKKKNERFLRAPLILINVALVGTIFLQKCFWFWERFVIISP